MNEFTNYSPPCWNEWFMKHVYLAAEKSKDPRTKVGAVLVKDNHIISTGYNGFPVGVIDSLDRYNDRESKYSFIVHAEHNSILTAARMGMSVEGSTLYTQGIPCNECSKAIIQSGIKYIVVHKQWPTMIPKWVESCKISEMMFNEADIRITILNNILGVKGYLDGKVIEV